MFVGIWLKMLQVVINTVVRHHVFVSLMSQSAFFFSHVGMESLPFGFNQYDGS